MTEAPLIEFVRLPWDDEAWHVTMRAADAGYGATQEFYTYPSALSALANGLRGFPAHRSDEVLFEAGKKEPELAHWVLLRVFIVDVVGHAAVTIDVGSNGDVLRTRSARFTLGCDVGSINRLGDRLGQWLEDPSAPLRERLYSS